VRPQVAQGIFLFMQPDSFHGGQSTMKGVRHAG